LNGVQIEKVSRLLEGDIMETFVIFSVFVLVMLVPVTIYALLMKRTPKLKLKDSQEFSANMESLEDKTHKMVNDEDIKRIRGRLRNGIAIPCMAIVIDVIAFAGLVNLSKEVTREYVLGAVLVILLLSFICFWRSYKVSRVFRDTAGFRKTNGCILKFKKIKAPKHYGSGVFYVYKVWVGFYDDEGKMFVAQDTIPEFIFKSVQKNGCCAVVLYQGRATTIIQG
jgi:hypothetical protein